MKDQSANKDASKEEDKEAEINLEELEQKLL